MDDFDIIQEADYNEDDFENRYADELEMLDEMEENERCVKPSSGPRKSLVFPTPDKVDEISAPCQRSGVSQAIKRRIDEMYALLSDGDSDEDVLDDAESHVLQKDSQAKRVRMSASPKQNARTNKPKTNYQTEKLPSSSTVSHSPPRLSLAKSVVFARPPMGKECVPLTGCDKGRRVYLAINKDEMAEPDKINKRRLGYRRPTNLLGMPFSILKETIHEQRRLKLLQESRRITEKLTNALDEDHLMNRQDNEKHDDETQDKGLWVDKYSPRSYMELLSDDGVNRNLLTWLKLWDAVVFGKDKPPKRKNDEKQSKKKDQKAFFHREDTQWMELDDTGKPVLKIALLCGPPGLGKTTLAHIVARHAGYNVVEMNASDDRSVDVFRNKIEAATQMQSVFESGKKPNCLVIDEIDGAPTPAINVLLLLIKKKDSAEISSQSKKRKRKNAEVLSRPIICICNDQHVPALRVLRQQAFVLTFPPTLAGRLAQRLIEVARKEVLQTDMTTMLALCDKAENDIRSCLNTLQFVRRNRQDLTLEYIQSANIGQKDTQKSLFSLWQAIFQLPRQKKKRLVLLSAPQGQEFNAMPNLNPGGAAKQPEITSSATRFYNMLHLASSNGQYSKLENGKLKQTKGLFALSDFVESDSLLTLVQFWRGQNWTILTYDLNFRKLSKHEIQGLLSKPGGFSDRVARVCRLGFTMPPATAELHLDEIPAFSNTLKETKTLNIMSSMLNDVSPYLRGNLDNRTVTLELLPLLLHIITPTLRPVNTQLFSSSEKQQLLDLINTMISYNLTYHQERSIEGQYTYVLDPKIEDVVKFPGLPQHKHLTYATKQLIAREIDLEKMRRMDTVIKGKNSRKNNSESKEQNDGESSQTKSSSPVVLKLKPKEVKPSENKLAKDFFGRPMTAKSTAECSTDDKQQASNNPKQKSQSPFWFKFQEGFSNAVRRTVKIQDLL